MIAAPFLAEFGWEIAMWVPWLRFRATEFINSKMIVVCLKGHEALYEDFADKVIPIATKNITSVDCQNVWVGGVKMRPVDYYGMLKDKLRRNIFMKNTLTPLDMPVNWPPKKPPRIPERQAVHRAYLAADGRRRDTVLLHARACPDKQPERNWPIAKWRQLVEELGGPEPVSIGKPGQSLHVPGTKDARGLSLKEVIELMGHTKVVIGPSSGPLHLANHCNRPVIWWSANVKDVDRYGVAWNPFACENRCAKKSWNPDVKDVLKWTTS